MQLNIYILSHPIIKRLSNEFIYPTISSKEIYHQNCKKLGIFIIYEVIRKWVQIQSIYIKQIDSIKELCICPKEESYLLITDLEDSYNIVPDALNLLPKVSLQHINSRQKQINVNSGKLHNTIIKSIDKKQKIILLYPRLNNYNIIRFLDYLILQKHVKINQIKIICITCEHKILEQLGNKHPNLNIYTTKIMKY